MTDETCLVCLQRCQQGSHTPPGTANHFDATLISLSTAKPDSRDPVVKRNAGFQPGLISAAIKVLRVCVWPSLNPGLLSENKSVARISRMSLLSCILPHGVNGRALSPRKANVVEEGSVNTSPRNRDVARDGRGSELRKDEIMMQLASEPPRILGNAPLRPVAEIT